MVSSVESPITNDLTYWDSSARGLQPFPAHWFRTANFMTKSGSAPMQVESNECNTSDFPTDEIQKDKDELALCQKLVNELFAANLNPNQSKSDANTDNVKAIGTSSQTVSVTSQPDSSSSAPENSSSQLNLNSSKNGSNYSALSARLDVVEARLKKIGLTSAVLLKQEQEIASVLNYNNDNNSNNHQTSTTSGSAGLGKYEIERLQKRARELTRKIAEKRPKKKFQFKTIVQDEAQNHSINKTSDGPGEIVSEQNTEFTTKSSNTKSAQETSQKGSADGIDHQEKQDSKSSSINSDSHKLGQHEKSGQNTKNTNQNLSCAFSVSNKKDITETHACGDQDVELRDLNNCDISLIGDIGAMHVRNLVNCTIRVERVLSSCLLHDSENTILIFHEVQQLRIHTSKKLVFFSNVASGPIIEDCKEMYFAPIWKIDKPSSGLCASTFSNKWAEVQDFKWLKRSVSPNWFLLPEPLFLRNSISKVTDSKIAADPKQIIRSTCVTSIWKWMQDGVVPTDEIEKTTQTIGDGKCVNEVVEQCESDDEI